MSFHMHNMYNMHLNSICKICIKICNIICIICHIICRICRMLICKIICRLLCRICWQYAGMSCIDSNMQNMSKICIICYVDFQYAQYAFPTLLMSQVLTSYTLLLIMASPFLSSKCLLTHYNLKV